MTSIETVKKSLYGSWPMIWLCVIFIAANAAGPTNILLEKMQSKAKSGGLDAFDWVMAVVYEWGLIGTVILAFRSGKFNEWKAERDKQKKIETETERQRQEVRADFGAK